jgi:hypothetical protein
MMSKPDSLIADVWMATIDSALFTEDISNNEASLTRRRRSDNNVGVIITANGSIDKENIKSTPLPPPLLPILVDDCRGA